MTILEVIAQQWKICVSTTLNYLKRIDPQRVHFLRYEDLVTNPNSELNKVVDFLNLSGNEFTAQDQLHTKNVGKGNVLFSSEKATGAQKIIEPMLTQLKYL